jgi:PAS domain S-box-containing protein
MHVKKIFTGRQGAWNIALVISTVALLVLNGIGLLLGITVVLPHLLYIPVVIGSYRYPRPGPFLALGIGLAYVAMVISFFGISGTAAEAAVRATVLVIIGWLIARLSSRLRGSEELYRGIFDNSEAGQVIVAGITGDTVIQEANWNAARLFGARPESVPGKQLSAFLGREAVADLMLRLEREGRVYGQELALSLPGGETRQAIASAVLLPGNRAALSFADITRRVIAEEAVQTANRKLHLLSRISSDHLHRTVDELTGLANRLPAQCRDVAVQPLVAAILEKAATLLRQVQLAEAYQNLGASPPEWIRVQEVFRSARPQKGSRDVSVRPWAERLEIFADPLFRDVLLHLVENAVRHGESTRNVIISYREVPAGLDLFVEDDGKGIPVDKKEAIFEYDSGKHAGLGLFICRQITAVTGMTIGETGQEGKGARFVIHVPEENYRVEGTGEEAPPFPLPKEPHAIRMEDPEARELLSAEFPLANEIWLDYHQTKGDPVTDRIFAAFSGGRVVSVARCRRHPDGLEVDAVFTPVEHRGRGYANLTVGALVEACGHDTLYMHSVLNLTGFYQKFGFREIPEAELPPTIRERFAFAGGELEGANVCPMKRDPPP